MLSRAAWHRVPLWGRWLVAYVAGLALAGLLGTVPGVSWGAALFVLGATAVLAAAVLIGAGGERKEVTLRAPDGTPLKREPVDPERRAHQIRLGVFLCLLGVAWWTPLAGWAYLF